MKSKTTEIRQLFASYGIRLPGRRAQGLAKELFGKKRGRKPLLKNGWRAKGKALA